MSSKKTEISQEVPEAVDLAGARKALEEEKVSLQQKLEEMGFGGSGLEYDDNFADSSQVTAERGEVETLVAQLREALSDVEVALSKMSSNRYGICENCGLPISAARLEAIPTAKLCITCVAQRSRR
ncbi:MAG: TraR/DksA family transcriptional regulator [Acidimicrobiaceae bacterium]|nr:TraR/DksA family transcriptional regulator [Acidimicrobiaceae bacterium]